MKKLILFLLLVGVAKWWLTDPTIDTYTDDISFSYVVKYAGNADSSDELPMLVALHGNGDKPGHFYETAMDQFQIPSRIILLEGPISFAGGKAWPWTASDLSKYGKAISEAVDGLSVKYPTRKKPILLGYSGGGTMAYYQALKHGNSYSYIYPISGKLNKDLLENDTANPGAPVFAYHGKSDSVVSVNGGRNAKKLLRKYGVTIKYKEFDGGHHGLFTDMKSEITHTIEKKMGRL